MRVGGWPACALDLGAWCRGDEQYCAPIRPNSAIELLTFEWIGEPNRAIAWDPGAPSGVPFNGGEPHDEAKDRGPGNVGEESTFDDSRKD